MLTNEYSINFGTTQVGRNLDSVKLPPWAQTPVDFIHKHRMALESEHVSAHLNEWIDLIFGYKQLGREAILSNNMFLYITYEGTVDINKISDPVQQCATRNKIAYFGQTPSQLLIVPHMKKMPLSEVLHLQTIFRNPRAVKPYAVPRPECCNLPASAIHACSDALIIVGTNAPAAHIAQHKWQPNTPDDQGTPFMFEHGKAIASSAGGALIRMLKMPAGSGSDEEQFPQALAYASSGIRSSSIVSITCDKEIVTGGHADNSIKLLSSDGAKTLETAFGHCAPVTCLALSPDNNYLVTGSRDTTVLLWRIHRALTSSSSSTSEATADPGTPTPTTGTLANTLAEKSRKHRIEGPIHVLRGHHNEVICCCVNSDLGIVVSCGHSSDVLLHSIRKGCLMRRFAGVVADTVCLSSAGIILTWNQSQHVLRTFTLNGIPVATAKVPSFGGLSCMEISVDGNSALIGMNSSSNGVLHVLKLGKGQDIAALALDKDNTNLLVSTADKQLIIFTNPTLSKKMAEKKPKVGRENGREETQGW
ncbi:BEACH domain-containing lvsC [Gossypium arboreum]|uniref:BEACH domain-containing lvsC n=1 Tax=Gossypium arboreum TaxID=29729 RepID=A0A0B0PUE3_GOSAR|nr:BEACH domain-containing lvsC [Gossypium arboreum]